MVRRSAQRGKWIVVIAALLWLWSGLAYHMVYFSRINPAAWGFAVLNVGAAAAFLWHGLIRGQMNFRFASGWRGIAGCGLLVYAGLAYPAVGWLIGHRFPAAPTFGLPCPTTIFTLGLLHFCRPPVPRGVLVVPLLWSAIGTTAAFQLGMYEDAGLGIAGLLSLGLLKNPGAQPSDGISLRSDQLTVH